VQDDPADRQAVAELLALQPLGPVGRQLDVAQFVLFQQFAGRHRLGQDHGDGLDVLDLLLVIAPLGAVLDDQDADGPAAAQQGGAEEGVIGVFARFRPVGEGRMRRRVRQADGLGHPGHLADQTLAGTQAGVVDGVGVQALGGEQLQLARGAAQIDGADLGDHRPGDDPDHHVQPVLRRGRARAGPAQSLADLAQEDPGSSGHRAACRHHGSRAPAPRRLFKSSYIASSP
jgi:hypothetical protein